MSKTTTKSCFAFLCLFGLFNLSLLAQSLPVPGLVSPLNNSTSASPNELLDWSASSGQTAYQYRIGLSSNLSAAPVLQVTSTQANTANLLFGTVYYWQVRAIKTTAPVDSSNWSSVWSFTTINQVPLVAPTNQATNQAADELLDWSPLSGITFYDVQYDTSAQFNSPLLSSTSVAVGTSQANTSNLRFGTVYFWRVRARHTVDTTLWSVVRSFTTLDQVPLVAPINQATNQAPNELLDWSPLSGITFYDVQYDTSAQFNSPLLSSTSVAVGTSQANTSNLRFGTVYFWRVRARHAVDTTQWSVVRSFTTLDQVPLVAPINQATNQAPNELLDWSPLSGITFYDVQYDTSAQFNSPLLSSTSVASGTSQANTSNLRFGTVYFWRVRARHTVDTTQWSAVRSFTTIDQLSLVSPLNAATNVGANPPLDWSALQGILNYQFQIDTLITFNTASAGTTPANSSQASVSGLLANRIYYWRVRAWHATDTTQWSAIRFFGVGPGAIAVPSFSTFGPFCSGSSIPALPTTSLNGISGAWSPAINNSQTTTYVFTPNSGQSAAATTLTIAIVQSSSSIDVQSACQSFEWINGITYTTSTNTPTVSLTNAAGCDSVVTLNLTITPLVISEQPETVSAVVNGEVSFSVAVGTPGVQFQWQTDTGNGFENLSNGGQFSGVNTPTLVVSAINTQNDDQTFRCLLTNAGCTVATDVVSLLVETTVGISEANLAWKANPNPATDQLIIHCSQALAGKSYVICDLRGQVQQRGVLEGPSSSLSIGTLANGLYFIRLENSQLMPLVLIKN